MSEVREVHQDLNAMDVYVGRDGTLYQMLPDALCGPDEGCCCNHCKVARENGLIPSTWNCLAVNADSEFTWTVHMPRGMLKDLRDNDFIKPARPKR